MRTFVGVSVFHIQLPAQSRLPIVAASEPEQSQLMSSGATPLGEDNTAAVDPGESRDGAALPVRGTVSSPRLVPTRVANAVRSEEPLTRLEVSAADDRQTFRRAPGSSQPVQPDAQQLPMPPSTPESSGTRRAQIVDQETVPAAAGEISFAVKLKSAESLQTISPSNQLERGRHGGSEPGARLIASWPQPGTDSIRVEQASHKEQHEPMEGDATDKRSSKLDADRAGDAPEVSTQETGGSPLDRSVLARTSGERSGSGAVSRSEANSTADRLQAGGEPRLHSERTDGPARVETASDLDRMLRAGSPAREINLRVSGQAGAKVDVQIVDSRGGIESCGQDAGTGSVCPLEG